jgi:acyl CoA:acetate/3-ketoacid CoA transferase beta subunit
MPEVEIFAMPDGINDTSTTGKWTLTEVTNPVAYDQVQRCTATFVKWSGMKRS